MPRIFVLERSQDLKKSLSECWEFFGNPANLPTITPPWLGFDTSNTRFEPLYAGQVLVYRVRPVSGVTWNWVTEITHVEKPIRFIDEQRFGPYRFWRHEHRFVEIPGGTRAIDLIHYAVPGGPLQSLVNWLFVRPKLLAIFDYRRSVVAEMLGEL